MPIAGIHIAAALTMAIGGAIVVPLTCRAVHGSDRRWLLLAMGALMPMCAITYHLVRVPIDHAGVRGWLGTETLAYRLATTLYAPLTEEPSKLWPLLIPVFCRTITYKNVLTIAVALGFGFGLGELWVVG